MGVTISSLFSRLFGRKEVRILMVGLDNAGKTTILYKLKLGQIVTTIPTIGFNVETLSHKNINFIVWDIAGSSDRIRLLWHHYYDDSKAVLFVMDSSDPERSEEAEEALHNLLGKKEIENATLLVLGNKQDRPNSMTSNEIVEKLKLNELSNQKWHVQLTCATEGHGLHEALDWLANELAQ